MFLLHIPLFQSTVVCNSLCTYRLVFFLPFISSLKWAAFTLCGESSNAAERGRDTAVRIVTTRQEDGGKCSRQNAKVKRKSLLSVLTHALYVKLNVCACVCVHEWMEDISGSFRGCYYQNQANELPKTALIFTG